MCPSPLNKDRDVLYLAGPMSGHSEFNFPAFEAVTKRLTEEGWKVISPATIEPDKLDESLDYYLRRDLPILIQEATAIAVLPGWEHSSGATKEVAVARWLGMPVVHAHNLEPYHEPVLAEATRIVFGGRREQYGHPYPHHATVAHLWNTYFGWPVRPGDVSLAWMLDKLVRHRHRPRRDNIVDIAGYAQVHELVTAADDLLANNFIDAKPAQPEEAAA